MTHPVPAYDARVEETEYLGWRAFRLTNGIISLFVAPDIGGRAVQLQLGEHEFFFANRKLAGQVVPEARNNPRAGWANYGGDKVWPAPEGWLHDGEWPGVPYYALDGSRFQSEAIARNSQEAAVRVASPPDPRTGIQFVRTFHVYAGTTRIRVDQVMRNISRRQIRWGIWHLIQNDAADTRDPGKPNPELYMYVPLSRTSRYPEGYYKILGDTRHPSYERVPGEDMLRIHYLYRAGKIGADSNRGWYAVVNGQKNIALVESFKYFKGEEYPDGASVESWNHGPGTISRLAFEQVLPADPDKMPFILESEVLSPYVTLDPGEEYAFNVFWSPTSVPNPVRDAVWAGAVSQPLAAVLDGARAHLAGVFGVFTPGTAQALFFNAVGEELGREALQPVDPRQVFRLEKTVPVPENAFRASVMIADAEGENLGFLGNVILR